MHPEKIDLTERFHQLRVSEDDQLKTNAVSVEIIDGEISSCRKLLALKELANKESLQRHCFQYRDPGSPPTRDFLCLRVNGLSLSRIGCIERLLWVQMLDLSDNELHSTEGLEAMQLLRFLNISRNKISSFSALDSLRLLKSLQVLDISYNEIGSHPIDTRRYLCASPLSHTVGSDWKSDQFAGLKLAQIDIVGNPVAEDKSFKSFLGRILPELKWLDGSKIVPPASFTITSPPATSHGPPYPAS
ncbi:hypothetical protein OROMI_032017 [Orobanche minor]